jgi:hypothetical protein
MVAPEYIMSDGGRHALADMVEFEMYLVAQSQQTPWPMLPRGTKKIHGAKQPHSSLIESSVGMELVNQRLIEATSSRTFVVSKSGYQFYEREMKSQFSLLQKGRE